MSAARKTPKAADLEWESGWSAHPNPSVGAFLKTILPYLPERALVYVEGTRFSPTALRVLVRHAVEPPRDFPPDTVAPKPRRFHLPATPAVVFELANLLEANPSLRWGHHLKIVAGDRLLADWHDADTGWPLHLSAYFGQAEVRALGGALECLFSPDV